MTLSVYGLKACDTCRRARKDLDAQGVGHEFIDLRDSGVTQVQIADWSQQVGWTQLLNKSSTTWRALGAEENADLDEPRAVRLMARHPALIKRPVIEALIDKGATQVFVGWTPATKKALGVD